MLTVVPKFKILSELDLSYNDIRSPQLPIVVNKINHEDTTEFAHPKSSSLRVLNLFENPIFKNMEDDPEEKMAMLSLLKTYNTIYNLGGWPDRKRKHMYSYYYSDIEYALRIHHAGRIRIVESSAGARRHSSDDGRSFFPESLWPAVLARAYENSYQIYEEFSDDRRNYYTDDFKSKNKSADGVFDLFRHGLAEL